MTTTKLLDEIHPGEVLLEDFMKAMGITARQLASDIDVPPSRISDIVNARRPITADTAVRLGLFFGMDARFWVNLQAEYDMRLASRALQQGGAQRILPELREALHAHAVAHHGMQQRRQIVRIIPLLRLLRDRPRRRPLLHHMLVPEPQ